MERVQDRPRYGYVPITNPGAGNNYAIKNTGVGDWLIVSMTFVFTASAVVANRIVEWTVDNGGNPHMRFGDTTGTSQNVVRRYSGFCGSNSINAAGGYTPMDFPVLGVYLPYGWNLKSVVQNLDAGDAMTNLVLQVIECPTGPEIGYMPTPNLFAYQGE